MREQSHGCRDQLGHIGCEIRCGAGWFGGIAMASAGSGPWVIGECRCREWGVGFASWADEEEARSASRGKVDHAVESGCSTAPVQSLPQLSRRQYALFSAPTTATTTTNGAELTPDLSKLVYIYLVLTKLCNSTPQPNISKFEILTTNISPSC